MRKIDCKPATTTGLFQFDVTADGLGLYTIDVSLPAKIEPGARLPVILVIDGNYHFDTVHNAVNGRFAEELASLGRNPLPPAIVVGVGYPKSEGMLGCVFRRNFDFYDAWDMEDPLGRYVRETMEPFAAAHGRPEMKMKAGGYDAFMAFLRDDLLPALAEHYPIDLKGRHTLIGHSSGGYFALRALYDPDSPFSRYIASSPGGGRPGGIEEVEAAYAANHTDLDADLFLCCGSGEIDGVYGATTRFASNVARAAEMFTYRQWPSGTLTWEIMNNEDHHSIYARAVAAGLRSLHGVRSPVGASIQAARPAPPSS